MDKLKERYRQFKEWQQQPHQVAPLSMEPHDCPTCGTHFEGNYCPRCGQSAKIGRYSFKKAFLLFLDVWGLGNRGMFRTVRDLLLRPGYMIRDYLRGMQMAYFPPFKMFFLIFTLSLLVDSGLNIQGVNRIEQEEHDSYVKVSSFDNEQSSKTEKDKIVNEMNNLLDVVFDWSDKHQSLVALIGLLLFCVPLRLMLRHSPAIPGIRLSECLVAMVYITNMVMIYRIIPSVLCFPPTIDKYYDRLTLILAVVAIKQLSGYSYKSTIWRVIVAFIPFCLFVLSLIIGVIFCVYGLIHYHII